MNSEEKRNSVKKDYDLIAEQFGQDYGTFIEDLDVYKAFEEKLPKGATILDLGAGAGRAYAYFNKKGYNYIGLDFSSKMRDEAFKIHSEFPYILDDMVNIKNHFESNSIDSVIAMYSLFHLPEENFRKVLVDVNDILKKDGVFLFSYQRGVGEEFTDEPYLGDKGKSALYMNYQTDDEIDSILKTLEFIEVYKKERIETVNGAINGNSAVSLYKIIRKG
ncbi:class I SAM-dependent methyltransferase [Candidatus Saccharibacteria bacterium]|nr:class I SAM-dependent methyltransferase [Candidatus Saccharibacteria bacterium]